MRRLFFVSVLLTFSCALFADLPLVKRRAIADLEFIRNTFEVQYAPIKWKMEYVHWNLDQSIEDARNKVLNHPNLTIKECQIIFRDFFNTAKDYHVGVHFFSTEYASLPFLIKGAQGRYFICDINRTELSQRAFPFEVGDELIEFDGQPIDQVIQKIKISELGRNTPETDQAMAEMILTNRNGELGHTIPSGRLGMKIKKKGTNKIQTASLNWSYIPEKISDFAKINLACSRQMERVEEDVPFPKKSDFFKNYSVNHFWNSCRIGDCLSTSDHTIGARSSYIPSLGRKIWQTDINWLFDAYIFLSPSGKKIGYIRIPHYIGGEKEVEEFGHIMNLFQSQTEALVIDQISNPGGSLFYLYGLASTLTDRPLFAPKHRIALTQEEVYQVLKIQSHLVSVNDDLSARAVFGETEEGYPIDYRYASSMKEFTNFIVSQWDSGKLITEPTFIFGVKEIQPHPKYRYSKPILILINSLDFSGGDFLPAILQDSKRGVVMGTRTAGAGGYVTHTSFPNHLGIHTISLTRSLAQRKNNQKIENLGVPPDILYELSVVDLQENYKEYAEAIVKQADALTEGHS